eukprot:738205-Prymnesium_polylepis.1
MGCVATFHSRGAVAAPVRAQAQVPIRHNECQHGALQHGLTVNTVIRVLWLREGGGCCSRSAPERPFDPIPGEGAPEKAAAEKASVEKPAAEKAAAEKAAAEKAAAEKALAEKVAAEKVAAEKAAADQEAVEGFAALLESSGLDSAALLPRLGAEGVLSHAGWARRPHVRSPAVAVPSVVCGGRRPPGQATTRRRASARRYSLAAALVAACPVGQVPSAAPAEARGTGVERRVAAAQRRGGRRPRPPRNPRRGRALVVSLSRDSSSACVCAFHNSSTTCAASLFR